MSEDRTTQIDNAQAEQNDSALVDRTQQLIDEVNRLMGAGLSAGASADVKATETPVSPTTATPQSTAEVNDQDLSKSATNLQSLLGSLENEESSPSVVAEVATKSAEVAKSSNQAVENTVDSPTVDEPGSASADDTEAPKQTEAPASESSNFDLAALNSIFSGDVAVDEASSQIESAPTATETASNVATATGDEAVSQIDSEAVDKNETSMPFSILETENSDAAEPEELTLPEAFSTPDPLSNLDSVAEPETLPQPEVVAEADADADADATNQLDMTQKYLDELRSAFDDESPKETEEPQQSIDSSSSTEAVDSEPVAAAEPIVEPEPTVEEPKAAVEPTSDVEPGPSTDDSAAASVESWLASRFGNTEESEDEQDKAEGQGSASAVAPESAESENAEKDKTNGQSDSGSTPQVLDANEGSSDESLSVERPKGLEARINRKLNKLEKRIGGMFASLSDQLNQIAHGVGVEGIRVAEATAAFDVGEDYVEEAIDDSGEAIDFGDEPVPENIADLEQQLTSKLREAEMELSVNRAKLSQQRASIEQMQADLERREAALEAKLEHAKKNGGAAAAPSSGEKKRGLMDRWKRHMGE